MGEGQPRQPGDYGTAHPEHKNILGNGRLMTCEVKYKKVAEEAGTVEHNALPDGLGGHVSMIEIRARGSGVPLLRAHLEVPQMCAQCLILGWNLKSCANCRPKQSNSKPTIYYCSRACQKADWTNHKPNCQMMKGVHEMNRMGDAREADLNSKFIATKGQEKYKKSLEGASPQSVEACMSGLGLQKPWRPEADDAKSKAPESSEGDRATAQTRAARALHAQTVAAATGLVLADERARRAGVETTSRKPKTKEAEAGSR